MNESMLKLKVRISTRAAIVAGKTTTGVVTLSLTDNDLAPLSPVLREEIAIAYEAEETIESSDPPIVEATMEALTPVLEARAKARAADVEKRKLAEARSSEEQKERDRLLAASSNTRSKALRAWVEVNGNDEQKARLLEGFLPEQEMLDAVADELLDITGYAPYTPLLKGDACDCACAGHVTFSIRQPPQYVDAYMFAALQGLRETAPSGASVEPVEHRAACARCKCVPIARITAKVSLPWEGWLLVREFDLKR